jgi:nickel superoxide dismutase
MLNLKTLITSLPKASAHCDIPCKIYDPSAIQIPSLTIIRLVDIISDCEKSKDRSSLEFQNTIARCVVRKEEESEKVKHETRILWGDYFKKPLLEKYPEIHELCHSIMLKASVCKQEIDRVEAESLLKLVNSLAEIFWSSKDIDTKTTECPYPPSEQTIYPIL